MSFNNVRGIKTGKEIAKIQGVRKTWKYCDTRVGNRSRHKMGITISNNIRETTQLIQTIIKKNYPESFPGLRRENLYNDGSGFIEITWDADKEPYVEEAFKTILEDKGCSIKAVAG